MKIRSLSTVALLAALASTSAQAQTPCSVAVGGVVGGLTLGNFLAQWTGAASYSPCPPFNPYDFNQDCKIDGIDLGILLAAWGPCSPGTPISTQLAGKNLASYPFFQYVRAHNQGGFLRVAIDPTRFPSIVGDTGDIYVTNHGVTVGGALVDVTGGMQTETFAAGTIQANTFVISGGGSLNGTTGTQVGIGYDVVFDMNQNGMLDQGDYVDGLGAEAGFYVVRNTAAAGPMTPVETASYTVSGITSLSHLLEEAYHPSGIAGMGQLPLIIMSHGNGHNYQWYDHLGTHMASYGYIVMSHQNNTVPGVATAAVTTIQHTNAFIGQQATILGGLFNGHIDASQIVWMGHSRGGEGITIAYDHLFDGTALTGGPYSAVGWTLASLKLLDSLCPVDFLGPVSSNPHDKPHHLWTAAGDADVSGCASSDIGQTFHIDERGERVRMSTIVYGTGHGDFHFLGGVFTGPCPIGVAATNAVEKGKWLPLVKRFLENDIPSKDFLWRQWEDLKPIGAPAPGTCNPPSGTGEAVVVAHTYRDDPASAATTFIIDSYAGGVGGGATGTSSSGGGVTFNVTNIFEGQNNDNNTTFDWAATDPMNGNTLARTTDVSNGVVFDWAAPSFYEYAIVPAHTNWSSDVYLSLRASQGTRHPNTTAALADLTFDVVLRDNHGVTSRINIGAYGGGLEEPYQRTSCGAVGAGWHNSFETIRIRLTDFLNNGSGIDLANIVALRLEFGSAGTSPTGRVALNEVYLTND